MAFFKEDLNNIEAFVFDIDGVLSTTVQALDENGQPIRTANLKDGYALVRAIEKGYKVALISGGKSEVVKKRFSLLGIQDIYIGVKDKVECLYQWMEKEKLTSDQVMYMGDDIPDYWVMQEVLLPVCPLDAASDIKNISKYISDKNGGEGCVRDVIEQVLRLKHQWLDNSYKNSSAF